MEKDGKVVTSREFWRKPVEMMELLKEYDLIVERRGVVIFKVVDMVEKKGYLREANED